MVAICAMHLLPPLYGRTVHLYVLLRLGITLRSPIWPRVLAEHLLGFRQLLAGVSYMSCQGKRRALDQIMQAMKEVGHTETLQALVRKLDQGFRPVTDQVPHPGAEGRQAGLHSSLPGRIGAVLCHFFQQQIPRAEVHQDQHHLFQECFIHRAPAPPAFSQAPAVPSSAASKACMMPRSAEGEPPTCLSKRRRVKNALMV